MSSTGKTGKHTTLYLHLAALAVAALFVQAFVYGATATGAAKEIALPYKATTIDECIKEKECVWHHFLMAIQTPYLNQAGNKEIRIKKWEKPVRVSIISESKDKYDAAEDYIKQIAPVFPQGVAENKKYNFLVMFTDDIEKELSSEFKETLHHMYGSDFALETYKAAPFETKCYYIHAHDSRFNDTIYTYLVFVQNDIPDMGDCLRRAIYTGFGLLDITNGPMWDGTRKSGQYSKLELLLILILQQDYMRSGMSLEQAKHVFDKIYEPTMKYVDESGVLNDNR